MKKMCLVLAALVAGGCAHVSSQEVKQSPPAAEKRLSLAWTKQTIVKGKTTKKEMLEKIGTPNSVDTSVRRNNPAIAEVWNYWTVPPMQDIAKGGELPVFRLVVSFDANGVVLDYQAADTSVAVR